MRYVVPLSSADILPNFSSSEHEHEAESQTSLTMWQDYQQEQGEPRVCPRHSTTASISSSTITRIRTPTVRSLKIITISESSSFEVLASINHPEFVRSCPVLSSCLVSALCSLLFLVSGFSQRDECWLIKTTWLWPVARVVNCV